MTKPTSPLSPITPHLICADAARAIDFYKRAFAAREMMRLETDTGTILHACLDINGATVMLMEENPAWGAIGPAALGNTPVTLHLAVDDADAWAARAVDAGATVVMPVEDAFWGDRYGVLKDPFGHAWAVATPVRTLSEEDLKAAARDAMASCPGSAGEKESAR